MPYVDTVSKHKRPQNGLLLFSAEEKVMFDNGIDDKQAGRYIYFFALFPGECILI